MSTDLPQNAYQAFLAERRGAITRAIAEACVDAIALYRSLGLAATIQAIDHTIGMMFEALHSGDISVLHDWAEQRLRVLPGQGLKLDQALRVPMFFRQQLLQVSLPALQNQLAGAAEGLTFLHEGCDQLTQLTSVFYDQLAQEREVRLRKFESLIENSVDGVLITDMQSTIQYANTALVQLLGFRSADQLVGTPYHTMLDPNDAEQIRQIGLALQRDGYWRGNIWARRADGSRALMQLASFMLTDAQGRPVGTGAVARDVTADHEAAAERARLQEAIIQMQDLTLRELSTPLLTVSDHVVVVPLIGAIDSRRAQQMIETLLAGITEHSADIAILDITGVLLVDTQVASAILRAAQAVRLLGAQVVLTGIRPEVAQTLVGLGADLRDIVTRSTLQSGIAYAIERRAA